MITIAIVEDDKNASKRFARAIDFYLVQDLPLCLILYRTISCAI